MTTRVAPRVVDDRPGARLPELAVTIADGAAEPHAAAPTLRFTLDIESRNAMPITSAMLTAQIRIAAAHRGYDRTEHARLVEVFGTPERWGTTMRSLYWAHATVVVPPFEQRTQVALLVPCTYDFDVVSAKYLHGLEHGEIPLELLFSGSVFYPDDEGTLKTARVSWELETQYRLPVRVWRDLMDHYFPGSAWLRVRRDVFDRLHALKSARGHATWEQTLDALLRQAGSETK